MTQQHLRVLWILSTAGLLFSLFTLPTMVCLCTALYFGYQYLRGMVQKCLSRGLIELCPERVREPLLNKSIFDIVCSLWFDTSFLFLKSFFKLLCRPLMQPIDRDNALDALNDFDEPTRQLYLTKGVVRVFPEVCQKAILGSQNSLPLQLQEDRELKLGSSDRNTEDKSSHNYPKRLIRVNSESRIISCSKMLEEGYSEKDPSRVGRPVTVRRVKKQKQKPEGLLETVHNSLRMLKRLLEMQDVGGHIQRLSTATLIKVMVVFWVALLLQVKFNKSARKTVIRMLYALGGMVTVLGVVSTTGLLAYKHWKKRKDSSSQPFQLEN